MAQPEGRGQEEKIMETIQTLAHDTITAETAARELAWRRQRIARALRGAA